MKKFDNLWTWTIRVLFIFVHNQQFLTGNKCNYFIIHLSVRNYVLGAKRIVSLRRGFLVPTTYVVVEKYKNSNKTELPRTFSEGDA